MGYISEYILVLCNKIDELGDAAKPGVEVEFEAETFQGKRMMKHVLTPCDLANAKAMRDQPRHPGLNVDAGRSKRRLAAYHLALCSELEREFDGDVMAWTNRDLVARNRQMEDRLRHCPEGEEKVLNAKKSVPFWEHHLLEIGG